MSFEKSNSVATSGKEPIAIIGIGCRFPGNVNNPETFWNLLKNGVDAITEIPENRWNLKTFYDPEKGKPGKMYTRWGGFLENIDQFDAEFFGISPREAAVIDPQQRLLLEVAWSALEDAGQVPEKLAGSNTGVFIGLYIHDYQHIQLDSSARNLIGSQMTTGTAMSIAANRLSYLFNFNGPSLALDTACSSSLVSVHLACQSIWNGESSLALAGGVNAILAPSMTIGMCKSSMLSPDGRCHSFDAKANGFVRGEGAGLVLLKPLSQALADSDPIYAVIQGTAVNQDGRTNGITVPNGTSQQAAVRSACKQAGVAPEEIQYIEAHGTGTAVGDPIEAKALGAVLGSNRSQGDYCIIGSVKSNMGHLESAAGVAGLIKAALAVKHRQIPPNLHFETPNPKIPFEELRLRVPQTLEPWPETGGQRCLAGVNSFGFGGTNAHVVLEAANQFEDKEISSPQSKVSTNDNDKALLLPLSARSKEALTAVAQATRDFLTVDRDSTVSLEDICYTASLRRGHHDHRLALVANSSAELVESLEDFIAGESRSNISHARLIPGKSSKLAFVFSGMGPQWWAMGRELLVSEPVFRETIQKCDRLFKKLANWSLWDEITASEEDSQINQTQIAQPAIFAIQVGLAALWRSWGITPDGIVGHSVGEVAAAHVAGVLTLSDAIRVIFHRSRVQAKAAGLGKMLAVGLSSEQVANFLSGYEQLVDIAAVNSPKSVTLAGDTNALEAIAQALTKQEIFNRLLKVEVPYHSPLLEPFKSELEQSLQQIKPRASTIPLFSTVTGVEVTGLELDCAYWAQNMRNRVLFAKAIESLSQEGYNHFLEISAHPVLAMNISECLAEQEKQVTVLSSLRRKHPEQITILSTLGKLYTLGYPVNWQQFYPQGANFIRLPSYPWQREYYWQESEESKQNRLGHASRRTIMGEQVHPLLGSQMNSAHPVWDASIDTQQLTYLNDHRVQGAVVYPGAAYVEMALAVAFATSEQPTSVIEDIKFQKALLLPENESLTLQLVLDSSTNDFDIYSQEQQSKKTWVRHVSGKLSLHNTLVPKQLALDEIRNRCHKEIFQSDCYEQFHKIGLEYGPCFQGIKRLFCAQKEALGHLEVPEPLKSGIEDYRLHPAILDACFQVSLGTLFFNSKPNNVYLPVSIDRICYYNRPGEQLWSHACLVEQNATGISVDIKLLDEAGNLLVEIQGLHCQSLAGAKNSAFDKVENNLYQDQWLLKPRSVEGKAYQNTDFIPDAREISSSLESEITQLSSELGRTIYYEQVEPQLDVLCADYIINAFKELGWQPQSQQKFTIKSLREELGVIPQHHRLFARMLEMLESDGILSQIDNQWQVSQIPARQPQDTWKAIADEFPDSHAELTLLGRCGQKLASVLRGEIDALELIFPESSLTTAEHLYQDSLTFRIYNLMLQKAITKIVERLPQGRKLRILEIGAGTGSCSSYVLPKLPAQMTEYVFTDVSHVFTNTAAEKFRNYPFIEYELLDIEKDPVPQGFSAHSFDLILATDVLHATRDLRTVLKNAQKLLASDGLLFVVEFTTIPRWTDLVFGLLKGWWRFADVDLRPSHPLLSWQKWQDVLKEVGFTSVAALSDTDENSDSLQSVILASAPEVSQTVPSESIDVQNSEEQGSWLIFADSYGLGEQLANQFKQRSEIPVIVSLGESYQQIDANHFQIRPDHLSDIEQLLQTVSVNQPNCRGIVHLSNLDTTTNEHTTLATIADAETRGCLSVLHLVQALSHAQMESNPRLVLVTCGVKTVGEINSPSVAQSPVWGLGRIINNEHPDLKCTKVDISDLNNPEEIQSLFEELYSTDFEDEIVLRNRARYVNRCSRFSPEDISAVADLNQPFSLEIKAGDLDNLHWRTFSRQKPAEGEVEIKVCATGFNFQHVSNVMDSQDSSSQQELGLECAGIITDIGEGVTGFEIGDEVIALTANSVANYTTTDARKVVPKPQTLSFESAATIPLAFLTAYYALHYLGRIKSGDRVLIHSAASGVGLAAVKLAQQVGAEIFATAGNPDKREFLRWIGVKHVMDSRDSAFAELVKERTDGKGVDIVLNSLPGEALPKSLSVLSAYGRFLEIGKWDSHALNKSVFKQVGNNYSFFNVDIAGILRDCPDLGQTLLSEVVQLFADKSLHALPYRVFPTSRIDAAYRQISEAKHIGKIVISLQQSDAIVANFGQTPVFRPDATYLITGGLGGFSLAVAEWMVEKGAKNLVLMSRSSADSPKAKAAVQRLGKAGARAVVASADVTKAEQVERVLADISKGMAPLLGIFHAAMVLDDAPLKELNQERMQKVMAPKIIGAWNLHAQSLNLPLDFFVMFSSVSSTIGNPGQGNYVAGNAFLDTLSHHRRAQGLPGLTINWGPITDAGYVAEKIEVIEHVHRIGAKPLPSAEALRMFQLAVQNSVTQLTIATLDWQRWAKIHAASSLPRFSPVVQENPLETQGDNNQAEVGSRRNAILAAQPDERQQLLVSCMLELVAKVLLTSTSKLDIEVPLTSLGFDSLMAVELSNRIKNELDVDVPPVKLTQGPSIAQLAAEISEELTAIAPADTAVTPSTIKPTATVDTSNGAQVEDAQQVLATLDQLSDTELETLLESMLSTAPKN